MSAPRRLTQFRTPSNLTLSPIADLNTPMTGQRALITGAGGFIGRHLVDKLLNEGRPVSALTRPTSQWPQAWDGRVHRIECLDWSDVGIRRTLAPHPFDVAFHLAAYGVNQAERDIERSLAINIALPLALIGACAERTARLLMAGTFSEYRCAETHASLDEDSPLETAKLYGASKAAGGLVTLAAAKHLEVDLRILRLFQVYGPGEAEYRLLPTLVSSLSGRRRVPLSPGSQILDFVHVSDVVDAFLCAERAMRGPEKTTAVWNVCTGAGHSVHAFATLVADLMGAPRTLLGFGDRSMRQDDALRAVGSGERMKRDLGWQPACDLKRGLRASLANLTGGSWFYA